MMTLAAFLHGTLAQRSASPWIIPDELIYSELAKGLVSGFPSVRGEHSLGYGVGYSLMLAPIWAIFEDVTTAYAVAKGLNAIVMSLTAIPCFFLARRFITEGSSLLVAGLSLAVPSLLYSGTLLTEVALYPAFTLGLLAIASATQRPTRLNQACALGAIGLACSIKMLAAVLLVAYAASIAIYHYLDTRERFAWMARLRAYNLTWVVLISLAPLLALISVASGNTPLGAYGAVVGNIDIRSTPRWALLHLAELDLYLAVLPFVATLIVAWRGLRSGAQHTEKLFVAVALPAVIMMALVVGAFASTPFPGGDGYPEDVSRLHERNMFVLAPIFFLGFVLWIRDRRGRRAVAAVALVVGVILPGLIPLGSLDRNVRFQALALVPWVESSDYLAWPVGVLVFTIGVGAFAAIARHAEAPASVFAAPVVIGLVVVTVSAHTSMHTASRWTRSVAFGESPRWIDDAVRDHETVSVLWAEPAGRKFVSLKPRHRILFIGEFFNRRLGTVFELGSPLPYELPSVDVQLEAGRVVLENGEPANLGDLVLAPCYVKIEGTRVAADSRSGATLVRIDGSPLVQVLMPTRCGERPR